MDTDYKRGEELGPGLLNEIEESKISIIVFSENFGSSSWCLEELVHILRCKRSRQQMVLPIFYKVEPSDVRKQVGTFGEAFVYHERKSSNDMERVMRWRKALTEAANLPGWILKDGSESKLINDIVEEISLQVLNRTYLHVAKYPVGIEYRFQDMGELLGVGVNDVRMVGILGISGIGMTTIAKASYNSIAKAIYNSIAHQFEGSCFLENVRENSAAPRGLLQLQKTLLNRSSAKSFVSKVFSAEWMFLIVSLMLEIFSAICDQLSSPRKPLYALFGMGLAIMALATCIWEFIHKGRRGNVQFGKCGILLWWFYCPSSGTLFGTFPEICGLIYAITQWASSMVQFVCVLRHKDNPFKVNILPVLFLLCLVVSKLIRNARGRTREETSEMELESIAVDS